MKRLKSDKGSALVLAILVVAMLGIITAATISTVTHNFGMKYETLTTEKTTYISSSTIEYTQSYLTKMLNTTFTYILYYNPSDPSDPSSTASPSELPEYAEIYTDTLEDKGIIDCFKGTTTVYSIIATDDDKRKPRESESRFNPASPDYCGYDYSDYRNNVWLPKVKQFAKDEYIKHLTAKLYNGESKAPIPGGLCNSSMLADLEGSMSKMSDEINNSFGNDLVKSISVKFPGFESNTTKAIKDFTENGYITIDFIIELKDSGKKVIQPAKFKWEAISMLNEACLAHAENVPFLKGIEVQAYYDEIRYE
ncbi:MAG: hypothetical protein J1F64_04325 [Oscillospiraceae bacterium]|nr:hypothetical protein [Oscillospiraceae bacterium]